MRNFDSHSMSSDPKIIKLDGLSHHEKSREYQSADQNRLTGPSKTNCVPGIPDQEINKMSSGCKNIPDNPSKTNCVLDKLTGKDQIRPDYDTVEPKTSVSVEALPPMSVGANRIPPKIRGVLISTLHGDSGGQVVSMGVDCGRGMTATLFGSTGGGLISVTKACQTPPLYDNL